MRWIHRLRSLFRRQQLNRDLTDELRFHVEMRTRENVAAGMSAEEARYAALRQFGNVVSLEDQTRDTWGFAWLDALGQDLRYGLRMLARSPGFTAVAVLSLALGIGANTAIFSLIDAVMLKLLPVENPQQLVLLNWASKAWPDGFMNSLSGRWDHDKSGRTTSTSFPYVAYEQIRDRGQVFSGVLALAGNGSPLNVGYKGEPGRADGELVSGTFFSTLGVQPILGRALTPDDDRSGASPACVVSYGYWERRFGRDPAMVGQSITVNSVAVTIVGVGPPEFYGVQPGRAVDVWLPLHAQPQLEPSSSPSPGPAQSPFEARDDYWVLIIGRLKPGVTEPEARAQVDAIFQQSMAAGIQPTTKPETIPHADLEAASKGLEALRDQFSKPLFILMTVVVLVLLIACANVADLLLARATARQKEIAVRLALGARRGRVIRQLLTESVLLAALGGILGLVLAFWATDLLVAFMSSGRETVSLSVAPDPRVLGFTAAVSVLTGILFGLAPALRGTRLELTPALKENAGFLSGVARGPRSLRLGLGKALIVGQIALSLLLLVGAGLFVRTLTNLENVKAGFDQRNLLLFGIDPTEDGYKGQRLADFYRELARHIEALPGVRAVTMSGSRLIGGGVSITGISIPGYTPQPGQKEAATYFNPANGKPRAYFNRLGPKFFETLGIPLVLGRTLGESDTESAPKVAVVNQTFARLFLGGGNPVGRRFGFGDDKTGSDIEIVGLAGDSKYSDLRAAVPPTVYVPALQDVKSLAGMSFEVRTAGDPKQMASAVRRAAQDLDPNLALYDVRTQVEQTNMTLFQERLFARLTSFFGLLAALLACIGVYGIMAFAAGKRTREIGIRMALGASRGEIQAMVLGETLVLLSIGIVVGIVMALETSRLISTLLFGLKPTDPLTIAVAALLMVAAAVFAGYVPARRAAKVDPMVALRYE
ncbi:MAG TPA: ABC transporter permease [Terriglobia bacterium]|nr:ABC transporter permease [Terriglobia bacterium]